MFSPKEDIPKLLAGALVLTGCSSSTPDAMNGGDGGDGGTGGMGQEFSCTEQGIRDAIAEGGGPHTFDCDGPTPVVTEAEIVIDNDVILDGEGDLTVDGNNDHVLFWVSENVTSELRGFGVTRGKGAAIPQGLTPTGIGNDGTLTVANTSVFENGPEGYGIGNVGTLVVINSTVSNNFGGGVYITGPGENVLINSTVSGNGELGGIVDVSELTVINSTVSGNVGPGIRTVGLAISVTNTLVDDDCVRAASIVSGGYNIESPGNTCGFDQPTDQVNVADPGLGPLQDNGGPTMTHALGAGSVAIDHIPEADCEVTEDQRGQPRPETGGTMCDVGAFEVQP